MNTLPISTAPIVMRAALLPACRVTVLGASASALGIQYAAQAAGENQTVVFLCGDNRFDPYAVARHARLQGCDARAVLQRILIARAFTAYQLAELLARIEPNHIAGPVIVSGLCTAFFDEDLSHTEAARLFYRTLWRVIALAQAGLALLLIESATAPSTRRAHFLTDLARASNVVIRLDGQQSCTLERRSLHANPYVPVLPEAA